MHPYVGYRTSMARHSLRQFLASMVNSLEILGLVFAPVMLGLLAFLAMPVMMAVTHGPVFATAAVAAQALLVALPVALLRKRLHPADAVAWERTLPVPPALAWRADWLVAGRIVGWMALMCVVSAAIWLYQWPAWLRPVWGRALFALALSVALGWVLAAAAIAARRLGLRNPRMPRSPRGARAALSPVASGYAARPLRPHYLALWYRLFWLPFWRAESKVGLQQSALLLAALAGTSLWALNALPLPRAALGLFASTALVLLVDRGDKAVREQAGTLEPSLAMWPVSEKSLLFAARAFTLLPAALVMALLVVQLLWPPDSGLRLGLAVLWLCAAMAASLAIVVLPAAPRGRVVLVTFSILLLTATGSELWP
jgi:hypothetical protein